MFFLKTSGKLHEQNEHRRLYLHGIFLMLQFVHVNSLQAANQMGCNICEGKHRRVLTERRPWCDARFCEKCQIFHSAKEVHV